MKKVIIGSALLLGVVSPLNAENGVDRSADQSVYRSVETITITNDDGSVEQRTITTVYYVFGYE